MEILNYYTGNYKGKQKFSISILRGYRKVITLMHEASNLSELSSHRGLNIEPFEGHYSARINIQYRIEFDFIKPNTNIILKISKHYE